MAKQLFSNNASSLLAASIDADDLTIQVASGFGALFPNPGAGEFFVVTLENAAGDIEHVRIASRASDLLTVASGGRGQEGSTAQAWTNGLARVECRMTKGGLETFLQRDGDSMTGDLDMNNNDIVDAVLSGTGTKMTAGEIVNVPIRGVSGDSSNQIAVPTDGTRATAGGARILVEGDTEELRTGTFEVGMVQMWFGAAIDCPAGWAICDGTGGTPDMRGVFPIGVSGTYALNATGGATTATGSTASSGAHDHGAATGNTTLNESQIPAHNHRLYVKTASDTDSLVQGFGATSARSLIGVADSNAGPYGYLDTTINGDQLSEDTGGGSSHNHGITSGGAHTHTLDSISTLPPYRALYFIMFVGYP